MHKALLQAGRVAGVLGGLTLSVAMAQQAAAPEIIPAPAFSAQQLLAEPSSNWITNGGDLFNQRYSPLKQINRDNVAGLKALWRTGMGSGTSFGNAGQAQILEFDGTLFVSNGANDVFAIDVPTGRILWTFHGNPDPKSGTPMGHSNRGVALGDGLVFVGQLDAKLVALDQRTGKLVWSAQVEPWQNGFSITAAPLYYDGLVIQGLSGGEMGIRGRIKAYDARTGAPRWTFYTVPAVHRFDRRAGGQDRQVPLAFSADPSRHLGLRLPESDGAVRYHPQGPQGQRPGGSLQDRLGLHPGSGDGQAAAGHR
jgi:glucose dehydrogenase